MFSFGLAQIHENILQMKAKDLFIYLFKKIFRQGNPNQLFFLWALQRMPKSSDLRTEQGKISKGPTLMTIMSDLLSE